MKLLIYLMIASLLTIIGIGFVQSSNQQLAYDIGGIFAGAIVGITFALFVRPFTDIRGKSISEAISILFQRQNRWIRGSKSEYIATMGMGALLAIMTIIGNYSFLGNEIGDNPTSTIVVFGIIGSIYGLTLLAYGLSFDYCIWQGKLFYYAIALLETLFLLSIVVAISNPFLATPFFVAGIMSRSITSIIIYQRDYSPDKSIHVYGYVAICLVLLIPLIYRL